MSDQPFDSLNAGYVQALYEDFVRNPDAVPDAWRRFFSRGPSAAREAGLLPPDALAGNGTAGARASAGQLPGEAAVYEGIPPERVQRRLRIVARATALIRAYREHGHRLARIDPLGSEPPGHPQLDPSFFGTSMEELEEIPADVVLENGKKESLADAIRRLDQTYSGSIGYEFEHLEDPEKVRWFWDYLEGGDPVAPLPVDEKIRLLERLTAVEGLEQFLHRSYLGQKRFSVEGLDMLIPMLDLAIRKGVEKGARKVVLGMAHRGRLNVLAHIVGISYRAILREFEGGAKEGGELTVPDPGTGDVKYHYGAEGDYDVQGNGSSVRVTLAPNPSHLEFVNPVVEGMARALQLTGPERDAEQDVSSVVPLLIHGDAAFAAEGVVAETLNLARLDGFRTGGTVHIIANNQLGFTTEPPEGRSTGYASDLAKGYDIPVIHVNADDPAACLSAMQTAMKYRSRYQDDVVIDLVGYRRHGHNEGDEPSYTQPILYEKIENHPTVRTRWAGKLVEDGILTEEDVGEMDDRIAATLREAQDQIREEEVEEEKDTPPSSRRGSREEVDTRVPVETLEEVNRRALSYPEGFAVHPKLQRQLDRRREDFGPDFTLEWAHAETLAFGSLLMEGTPVRLTGQDSVRGTFSQRHLRLNDVETGETLTPLAETGEARFEVHNSPLTETAVLGFEYGFGVSDEETLVLWEAQFGDFVNVAQVVIDQFISSGRAKWNQVSGVGLLLPHGYEGQGPEHSSARLERFLELCAEDNMRVLYPTTPGQYFHLLRRQAHARPRRPLVVMTPKSLLRHPRATSSVRELAEGGFRAVLDDPSLEEGDRKGITRLILCSGKVYYDLQGAEEREEARKVAVARIEELYPFPGEELKGLLASYPSLEKVIWAQEEPRNMGALTYVGPRLRSVVPREISLRHVSRPERASPAEGKASDHQKAQERIVTEALHGR